MRIKHFMRFLIFEIPNLSIGHWFMSTFFFHTLISETQIYYHLIEVEV